MNRAEAVAKIRDIAERTAEREGIEVVEVDLKGGGRHQVLLIVIDKPSGVTHGDCELISQQVGTVLDAENILAGAYQLEVSSPGVERKLVRWKDWVRFVGKKAKVVLREPVEGTGGPLKYFEGVIAGTDEAGQTVTVRLPDETEISFPAVQVDRANLKFEW
jgi:ribosome maturation factor RimP